VLGEFGIAAGPCPAGLVTHLQSGFDEGLTEADGGEADLDGEKRSALNGEIAELDVPGIELLAGNLCGFRCGGVFFIVVWPAARMQVLLFLASMFVGVRQLGSKEQPSHPPNLKPKPTPEAAAAT